MADRPPARIGYLGSQQDQTNIENLLAQSVTDGYDFVVLPLSKPRLRERIQQQISASAISRLPQASATQLLDSDVNITTLGAATRAWIEPDSKDDLAASISKEILHREIEYASYCGIPHIILPAPKRRHRIVQYAQALKSALGCSTHAQVSVHLPISEEDFQSSPTLEKTIQSDPLSLWEVWNTIRSVCDYHPRLSVALQIPPRLPVNPVVLNRWFTEPIKALVISSNTFLSNAKGFPVLSKTHQLMITRFMALNPFVILQDTDTLERNGGKLSYLQYIRYLHRSIPPSTATERFTAGYQDFLQTPLQPLMDNLESMTYEVFEKDPVKYSLYEKAIHKALSARPKNGLVIVAVVGAGRGPLVTCTLRAARELGRTIELFAIEKNPNAFVTLQRRKAEEWGERVQLVRSDIRSWDPPILVDILISELLGSFGDNELSPECIDGAQRVLNPDRGISIPASYTAHITPIMTPKLYANISKYTAPSPYDTPYVVLLTAFDSLSNETAQIWEFQHPNLSIVPENLKDNVHNRRSGKASFHVGDAGVVHGIAGYFEAVLYGDIELSIRPNSIDKKNKDMISWFPIFFPLKTPIYVPQNCDIQVMFWRETDGRKVWYEWIVEVFMNVTGSDGFMTGRKIKISMSDLHNAGGKGSHIGM
ncbi:Protein arginine N-methyltransferase skb1 [Neolecta irregularis DAH-3]|uniref:Protein arginine N-methyltransferase n=1 Tax=Neolecta irregularis (strain DAH-3) TaxID=1198029 RepID=A0A1U7LT44_NEOID|nr:Protein arginine N-methyltransferase skb1 [Neolecta irregularis DAH-3]|eukprot:OLL25799.1 Protein arginine N-methyltransferase skb1 [Neolecta irregularis DAH-3]